jgi:oxygen-independent coproporphyrinogen-3 oxidase
VQAITSGRSAEAGDELLTGAARAAEAAILALRTAAGIKLPLPAADPSRVVSWLDELGAAGLLERAGDRVVLTRHGRLLGNEVAARLLVAMEQPPVPVGTR